MARDGVTFAEADQRLAASFGLEPESRMLQLARTGATVRVQIVGEGPTVVFVHGGSNAGSSWLNLVAQLSGYRCVVLDRPGCGLSPPVAKPMTEVSTFQAFADDVIVDVIDALGETTASVVGTSFGGYFSLRGVAAHPERIDKLVLLGWAIGAPAGAMPLIMRLGSNPFLSKITAGVPPTKGAVKAMLKQIGLRDAVNSGAFNDEMIGWFRSLLTNTRTMRNEVTASPRVITMRGLNPAILLDDEVLRRVSVPTLWLWGRDDPFGGEAIATAMAPRLPNATLEMVDGGHAVWIDDVEAIAKRIGQFLA